MRSNRFLAALTLAALAVAACAPSRTPSTPLDGSSWLLADLNGQAVLPETPVTLNFESGRIHGTDGCNRYSGSYTQQGTKLSIGKDIVSTKMACAGPVMQQAMAYIAALTQAATFKLDGQQLRLSDANGKTLATLASQSASIALALLNAAYPIEWASTGTAQLQDGVFEEPVAPGSATKTMVRLGEQRAFGDINGDGAEDAAVTLVADPGGSGTFTYLAAVINQAGAARPAAALLLGDRIVVKALAIQSGKVVVSISTRRPEEPMSAAPSVQVTRSFAWQGDRLVEATGFAIYLLAGDTPPAQLVMLSHLELEDQPFLSASDIASYTQAAHEMELTPSGYAKIHALSVPVSGKSFAACVDGQPIYAGAFWVGYSSLSFDGVVIDTLSATEEHPVLRIELGYPGPGFFHGDDPRSDARILQALKGAGKLK